MLGVGCVGYREEGRHPRARGGGGALCGQHPLVISSLPSFLSVVFPVSISILFRNGGRALCGCARGRLRPSYRVLDGERLLLLVRGDGDLEGRRALLHRLAHHLEVAQLLHGVGRVGDELPEEDLLIGVDGVGHDVQQLPRLRLELELLLSGTSERTDGGGAPSPSDKS